MMGNRGIGMSKLLTIQEASDLTRLAVKTLYSYSCRREIPVIKLKGRILFDEDRLRRWVDSHAVEPVAIGAT